MGRSFASRIRHRRLTQTGWRPSSWCRRWMNSWGVAVALGLLLLDVIVVRSVLVTAPTLDVGRLMWWPSA